MASHQRAMRKHDGRGDLRYTGTEKHSPRMFLTLQAFAD